MVGLDAHRADAQLRRISKGRLGLRSTERVKQSAIPYAGYEYQTLQGIRVLAQWLDSPAKYQSVRFEADKEIAPQGLDDIVCERSDGLFDFLQVKFTPSPDKQENQLSWQWLLQRDKKKSRSRSLLRKWHDALSKVDVAKLGEVSLLTNRIPDEHVQSALRGGHLDFSLAPLEVQTEARAQFEDISTLRNLLARLVIQHSDKGYLNLRREVSEALHQHTDEAGVHRLYSCARDWAIFENSPGPSGWISLEIVRSVLSVKRPQPIPEDFEVPEDYALPDEEFHEQFKTLVLKTDASVFVVSGPPGRGKSTYLSNLCQEFSGTGVPYVRHHYFLSVGDARDRLSPRIVAESLLAQIVERHSDIQVRPDPERLAETLRLCAEHYEALELPFVVVMDGLDHVWRDNDRDKRPLDELFNQLIPTPRNLKLIIGTQPVDDENLPGRLTWACPRQDWRQLPPMSGNAVANYLTHQVTQGRLQTYRNNASTEEEVAEGAAALLELTKGHPLHVIYAVEELIAKNMALTSWEVSQLPSCPGPDIRSYYRELWRRLTFGQRDILHLVSAFPFYWPRPAFSEMGLDSGDHVSAISQVEHLLHSTASGLKPFHESLIVFVTEQEAHEGRVSQLTVRTRDWLKFYAPSVLRCSWLWSVELKMGNDEPLRTGLTRDWVIQRLAEGYGLTTVTRLLSEAESAAFRSSDYADAYRHRALKTRLQNGPEFQISDNWRLFEYSLALCVDDSVIEDAVSSRHELNQQSLASLTLALSRRVHPARQTVGRDLLSKYRRDRLAYGHHHHHEGTRNSTLVLRAASSVGALDLVSLVSQAKLETWPLEYWRELASVLEARGDVADLFQLLCNAKSSSARSLIEASAVRAAITAGADIAAWDEFRHIEASGFATCYAHVCGLSTQWKPDAALPSTRDEKWRDPLLGESSTDAVCRWFFASLIAALSAVGPFEWLPAPKSKSEPDSEAYLTGLTSCAAIVAKRLKTGELCDFSLPFTHMAQHIAPPTSGNHEQAMAAGAMRRALPEIAAGVLILCSRTHKNWRASSASVLLAKESSWFNGSIVRTWCDGFALEVFTIDAVRLLIDELVQRQASSISETNERAEELLVATSLALKFNLLELARATCELSWDYVLGYGAHKDPDLTNYLGAVGYLAKHDCAAATEALIRVAPQINEVTEYTDGDGAIHVQSELSELLAQIAPDRLATRYGEELERGNWYRAESAAEYMLKHADLTSPVAASYVRTGATSAEISQLKARAEKGDSRAEELLAAATAHLGGTGVNDGEPENGEASRLGGGFDVEPSQFSPSQFQMLRTAMKGTYSQREYLHRWYEYWVGKGKESELLRALRPVVDKDMESLDDTRYLLDKLFDTSVRLEGSRKAFDILVKAHVELSGWSGRWFESTERSEDRLKKAAQLFRFRSDEFIQRTCKTSRWTSHADSTLVVPSELLVLFLLEVGRKDEARRLLDSMAAGLEEATRRLPLKRPVWAY